MSRLNEWVWIIIEGKIVEGKICSDRGDGKLLISACDWSGTHFRDPSSVYKDYNDCKKQLARERAK
jgi:hypothetical protein